MTYSALDPSTADRLAKLCGLFGSDHDGERATAAAMAHKLLRQRGLSWQQIIIPPSPMAPLTIEQMIDAALSRPDLLDAWEHGFIRGIRGRQFLTQKQLNKLRDIAEKVRGFST